MKLARPSASEPTSPHTLSPQQRSILQNVIKQEDLRGQALFALGYWAGCRVTDTTLRSMQQRSLASHMLSHGKHVALLTANRYDLTFSWSIHMLKERADGCI